MNKDMKTTSNQTSLTYTLSKEYVENGQRYFIKAKCFLGDDCNNGKASFSITVEIYLVEGDNMTLESCGCCHDEIVKQFPELKPFIMLHLCDYDGKILYPVSNGTYLIKNESEDKAKKYLRITSKEYDTLKAVVVNRNKFKEQLYNLGIINRWEKEGLDFIKFLEDATKTKWLNPYSKTDEKTFW